MYIYIYICRYVYICAVYMYMYMYRFPMYLYIIYICVCVYNTGINTGAICTVARCLCAKGGPIFRVSRDSPQDFGISTPKTPPPPPPPPLKSPGDKKIS
jgi:hypothetical protein